jgi:dephospho-CoA kinase
LAGVVGRHQFVEIVPNSQSRLPHTPGRIALTGGIATGKSTVAKLFAELGAYILDADLAAREVVKPGASCWQRLRDFLGPSYFEENGTLKRRQLREEIIRDDRCRATVNAILHPHIMAELDRQWQSLLGLQPEAIIIFDIPLLFEADMARHFQTIILAYTSREIQIQRLMVRDSLSREEALGTLSMQLPIEAKRSLSHLVIDNSFDLAHTRRQVKTVWEKLRNQGSLNTCI